MIGLPVLLFGLTYNRIIRLRNQTEDRIEISRRYFNGSIRDYNNMIEAYTGSKGAKGQDYQAKFNGSLSHFTTTRPLQAKEGLTVVVQFPKSIVHEPGTREKWMAQLSDSPSTFIAVVGLLLVACYLGIAWLAVGIDPARGTIIPLFEPPKGTSPAAAR